MEQLHEFEGKKNMVDYKNLRNFTMENYGFMILWKKNYGTMDITIILYRKLWSFDLLWKKYGTMEKTMVL